MQQLATFDPATARRSFRISMSDMSELCFLPPLLTMLDRRARGILQLPHFAFAPEIVQNIDLAVFS